MAEGIELDTRHQLRRRDGRPRRTAAAAQDPGRHDSSEPGASAHGGLVGAAAAGALIAVAFLVLSELGVPALGWVLLAMAATVALADTVLSAIGLPTFLTYGPRRRRRG